VVHAEGLKRDKEGRFRECYRELGRVVEMAVEDNREEIGRKKLDCAKKTSYVI
jgi:hypothetical protein